MASLLYKSQLRLVNCTFFSLISFEAKQLSKLIHQNQFNVSVHVNKKREGRYWKATKERFQNEIDELLLMLT